MASGGDPATTARQPREDVEETRRAILRTAQRLFMEHGYRAVSTRQVADACGLTQPALYHHFAGKRDLYLTVIREDSADARVAMERIARRDESAEARLALVARYLMGRTQHDLGMMLHDIRYELDQPAQDELRDLFYAGHIGPLAAIFADGVRRGELRDSAQSGVDPVTAAFLFLSMLSFYLQGPASPARDAAPVERAIGALLHGLAASSPAANER